MTQRMASDIMVGMWVVWGTYWYAAAFNTKKSVYVQPRWQRWLYLVPGAVILAAFQIPAMRVRFWPFRADVAAVGMGLAAAGFGFCMWARVILGRNWSGIVTVKEGHELVQRGPYAVVRHPIYTGIFLAIIGTILALTPTPGGILVVVVLLSSFFVKLLQEEKVMIKEFPEAYPAYKERVRARLVPFVI